MRHFGFTRFEFVFSNIIFHSRSSVKLLLKAGAYANIRSKSGATPLFLAAKSGHLGAAKVLIK